MAAPCAVAGAPHAGCCPAGSLDCLPPSRPGGAAAHRGRRRLAACPGTRPAAPGISRRRGRGPDALASLPGPGAALVRRWRAHRVPADARGPGPGGMRYRARHLTIARCRPRWRPATDGRRDAIPVARLPTPGPPGRGRGTGGRHLRFHRHGQVGLPPRHRRAARDRPRPSDPRPDFFEFYRSSWSPVTESNRRPSPYHACRFRPMASLRVGLPQVRAAPASEYVVLLRPIPEGVVAWFVTGSKVLVAQSLTG